MSGDEFNFEIDFDTKIRISCRVNQKRIKYKLLIL